MKELELRQDDVQQFEALKKQAETIALNCSKLTVTDDTSLAIATQNLSKAKEVIRNIEKIRKSTKEPYLKAGQQIDALAKNLSNPIETALNAGEKAILAYNKIKEEEARKEQARINDIKNDIASYLKDTMKEIDLAKVEEELDVIYKKRIGTFPGEERWYDFIEEASQMRITLRDYIKQRLIQIRTPDEADETVNEVIAETITNQLEVFGAEEIKEAEFATTSNIKEKWVFELEDITKVPAAWLSLNEKAVNAWLKTKPETLEDGKVLGGVKFSIEKQLKIR